MKYFICILLSLLAISTNAQVGINTISPSVSADLDIRNTIVSADTIPRGIFIPRMTQKQRDAIPTNGIEFNSLMIYNTDTDCYNYYSSSDAMWLNLCGSIARAKFSPISCSDIEVVGQYIQNEPTNHSNYLKIRTNVLSPGSYVIKGLTGNGYFFYGTGEVVTAGAISIDVPAFGSPNQSGVNDLTLNGSGIEFSNAPCNSKITVTEPVATFSLNCSSINIYGSYSEGNALTSANYIEMTVNPSTLGSYLVETDQLYGIKFSGFGTFTSTGAQTIRLMGSGTPTLNTDFILKIKSNSSSGLTQCSVTIPIVLPPMTYAVIGAADGNYSWATSPRKEVLGDSRNFSPTGTVKISQLTQLWSTASDTEAATYLNSGYNGAYPDLVLFYSQGVTQTAALGTALANYINQGGSLIYGASDAGVTGANYLLSAIWGSTVTQSVRQVAGSINNKNVYPILQNSSDPIVNGPFGDLSNSRFWGEGGTSINTVIVPSPLPDNSTQLVSAFNEYGKPTVAPSSSVVWYNDSKNFVYFGNSVGASTSDVSTSDPAYFVDNQPATKSYGTGTSLFVFNSALELNAIAWCLRQAVNGGINH